jgi:glycosyltransferase involved in cell wall biosynthesis
VPGIAVVKEPLSVLWLARSVPLPLDAGGRVYTYRTLTALARSGVAVTFLGITAPDGDGNRHLPSNIVWKTLPMAELPAFPALLSPLPLVTARSSPAALVKALQALLQAQRFDAVVIDAYQAGWALPHVQRLGRGANIVYLAHNFEEQLARDIARTYRGNPLKRVALHWNARKIARLERRLTAAAGMVVCLTEHDRTSFRALQADVATLVLPPGWHGTRVARRTIDETVPRRVVMLGSVRWVAKQMNVAAFIDAADQRFAGSGITLDIIGDTPEEFKARWGSRLRATRFRGFVEDVEAELAASRIGLMIEATGGGFKLKILDYLYNRVPVFALAGSFEGLPPAVTDSVVVEADMNSVVDRVIASIDDLQLLNRLQNAAFEGAASLFDWDENGRRLAAALKTAGARSPAASAAADHRPDALGG